jgi:hypothetical protein
VRRILQNTIQKRKEPNEKNITEYLLRKERDKKEEYCRILIKKEKS